MKNDLMQFESFALLVVFLLCTSTPSSSAQHTIVYVKRGETAELCDNRTTLIFAYEYRSLDGLKNLIVEPNKHDRYSNPHGTSLLRISKAIESDSGLYKCPQDDTEWQKLQVYGTLKVNLIRRDVIRLFFHFCSKKISSLDR